MSPRHILVRDRSTTVPAPQPTDIEPIVSKDPCAQNGQKIGAVVSAYALGIIRARCERLRPNSAVAWRKPLGISI